MSAPAIILDLVERFHQHLAAYKQNSYNEEQLRIEFLNPMFQALGWDMDNTQGYAVAYKDLIHEDALRVSGVTKAPDYAFRIGGVRKFFLEAKKPSVNIKDDIHPAYQLLRAPRTSRACSPRRSPRRIGRLTGWCMRCTG